MTSPQHTLSISVSAVPSSTFPARKRKPKLEETDYGSEIPAILFLWIKCCQSGPRDIADPTKRMVKLY